MTWWVSEAEKETYDDDDDGVTFKLTVKGKPNTGYYLLVRQRNIATETTVSMRSNRQGHECKISAWHMHS